MAGTSAIEIGGSLWRSRVYSGLSVASQVAAILDPSKAASLSIVRAWKIYSTLGVLAADIEQILAEYDRVVAFPCELSTEKIQVGRDILLKLYADCVALEPVPDGFPLHGPMNRRLAGIRMQAERILDVADWFDIMMKPDEAGAKFEAAMVDMTEGEVVPWSAVQ